MPDAYLQLIKLIEKELPLTEEVAAEKGLSLIEADKLICLLQEQIEMGLAENLPWNEVKEAFAQHLPIRFFNRVFGGEANN